MEWLIYLLKVSACLVAFYIPYFLFFSKCTFIAINRIYLIASILLSFSIPLMTLSLSSENVVADTKVWRIPLGQFHDSTARPPSDSPVTETNWGRILTIIYAIGATMMMIRLAASIRAVWKIKRNASDIVRAGRYTICRTTYPYSFSFFNLIFIPVSETDPVIIQHEKVHIRQFHWVDLIILEVASVILWFNPVMIFYKRSLKLQHEYLADAGIISREANLEEYLDCLLRHSTNQTFSLPASPFYSTSIKQRIIMMTRRKNHLLLSVMYIAAVPAVVLLLMAFANRAVKTTAPLTGNAFVVPILPDENKPSISPVDLSKVTALNPFGDARNWATNMIEFHSGVDFEMEEGSEIAATADGIVVEVRTDPYRGNYILIKHDGIYSTHYSHMKDWAVKEGEKVTKGQVIGYVGATGRVLSPHLHYEVWKMRQPVNPKDFVPKINGC